MKTVNYIDTSVQVENKDPFARGAVMADLYYIPAVVVQLGEPQHALFTEAEINRAIARALRNPEDAPKPFSRTLLKFLGWLSRGC